MVAEISTPVIPPHRYPHLNPSLLSANRLLPRILTTTGHSSYASSSSSSSCSSSPATTHTSNDSWGLKSQIVTCKPEPPPARRKKASRACGHCQKAHLTCDDGRPCVRCTKRGLSKTCADGVRKKAKYLSDYDDALLVRPRPPSKQVSEDILETRDYKKVKVMGSNDQDCHLSISWAGPDLLDNAGISPRPNLDSQSVGGEVGGVDMINETCTLVGLEEWLARFENGDSVSHGSSPNGFVHLDADLNQVCKPSQSRQRMQEWVERIDRLVEIKKLTMNITADDEWMLKRNLDRSLMELERVIALSGTPTIIWSTSGEILKVGDEFCMLTEWSRENLIGRHIENVFEYESLEEYLDLVEASIFPDEKFIRHQTRPGSRRSQSSCHKLAQVSSSSPSLSPLSSSLSPPLLPLMSLPHVPNATLNHPSSHSNDDLDATTLPSPKPCVNTHSGKELNQTIKWFGIRKACGQESIGCSFSFKIRKDLFDCPSAIIGSFLPILTRTSFSDNST